MKATDEQATRAIEALLDIATASGTSDEDAIQAATMVLADSGFDSMQVSDLANDLADRIARRLKELRA